MNPINETHPFLVSIWVNPTVEPDKPTFFDKPYWMELARCQSEMRAIEVAQCLSIRHRLVQVSQLQGERFVQIKTYPNDETVKRETQSASELKGQPAKLARPPYYVGSHGDARQWRNWTYNATDQELLAALRGAGDSFDTVPAQECSDELKNRGYTLWARIPTRLNWKSQKASR